MAINDADLQLKLAISMGIVDTKEMMKDIENQVKPLGAKANALSKAASVGLFTAASGLAAVAGATVMGVKSLIGFEDAFAGVRKTVDADKATLERLSLQIRELATEIPIAANELARIGELGGQLGIGAESLEQFIEVVSKLGVATVLSTESAAMALARLAAIADIPEESLGDFFERTSSALVDLGNNFAATEDEIVTTVLRIATAAKQSGATTQDALAFATALQAVGVPAQAGGTAVARVFQEIQRAVQNGGEQLNLFARVADVSISEFSQLFAEDASMAVATFVKGLDTADERGIKVQDTLKKLNLSQRRTQLAIGGLSTAGDLLIRTLTTSRNAYDANIALNIEAAKKFTTTAQQMQLLRNQFKETTMQIAEEWLPTFRSFIFGLQGFISGVSADTIRQFRNITAAVGALFLAIKTITIAMRIYAITTAAAATASAALQAFINPAGIAMAAVALGAMFVQFSSFYKLLNETSKVGAGIGLANLVNDAQEYGLGLEKSNAALQEGLDYQKELFKNQSGLSYEDVFSEEGANNAEKITNALSKKGITPTDSDVTKWSAIYEQIEGIAGQMEAAQETGEYLFETQLEKAKGLGAGLGDIFNNIDKIAKGNSDMADDAQSLLESIFIGGGDPELLLKQFTSDMDAYKAAVKESLETERLDIYSSFGITSDMDAAAKQEIISEKASLETQKRLMDIQKEIAAVDNIQVDLIAHTDSFAALQKESSIEAAKLVMLSEENASYSETELNTLAQKIQGEREEGRLKAINNGIALDTVALTEYSQTVKDAELVLEEKITQGIIDRADAIAFEISSREIAMMKVEAIAKQAAQAMVSLFDDVPEQVKLTANEVVRNLQDQAIMGMEFMETIAALQEQGFVGLAAMLAKEGPKALAVAQQFLKDGDLALEAESRIAQANTALLSELQEFTEDMGLTDNEIREKFVEGGGSLVQGIAEGIRSGDEEIRKALTETVNKGLEGFEIEFKISSPSEDENVQNAGYEIIRGLTGRSEEAAKYFEEEVVKDIGQAVVNVANGIKTPSLKFEQDFVANMDPRTSQYGYHNMQYIIGLEQELDRLDKLVKTKTAALTVDYTSARYKQIVEATKDSLKDTFNIYTGFISTLGSINQQAQATVDAERELTKVKEYNLKLTEKKAAAEKRYNEALKKFGRENIVTDYESLQIKQEQLSLIRQQRDANKTGSASQRLAIKDAKREVEFLEQAVKRGVATEDELQAARERLADAQGTTAGIKGFQNAGEYQTMLDLQKSIAELQIKFQKELIAEMETASKEVNQEVIDAEKEKSDVANEIADATRKEGIAQDNLNQAKLAEYNTQLQLLGLADELIALGPKGEANFRKIATAVGMPEEEINALVNTAKASATTMAATFDGIAGEIAKVQHKAEEGAKLTIEIQDTLNDIDKVKQELNNLYAGVNLPFPFPEIASKTDIGAKVKETLAAYENSILTEVNEYLNSIGFNYPEEEETTNNTDPNSTNTNSNNRNQKKPPMFHKGGFLGTGGLGIVGEIGPEVIKVRPNGVDIRPLPYFPNDRGFAPRDNQGNIIVEHLAVNVTGIPTDRMAARKAAIEIEKALVNLRREGNSSSVLGR